MRGWKSGLRTLALALLGLCALSQNAAAGESWKLPEPKETSRFHFEWRDEWTVELSPAVAQTIQELITEYIPGHSYRRAKPEEWSSRIRAMLDSDRLSPQEKLTLLWWYRADNADHLPQVIAQLRRSELTADWAVVVSSLCADVANHSEDREVQSGFKCLAHEYSEMAAHLDPGWALPYYVLITFESASLIERIPPEQRRGLNFSAWHRDTEVLPLASFEDPRKLMRQHVEAGDYRELLPPPWMQRSLSAEEMGDGAIATFRGVTTCDVSPRLLVEDAFTLLMDSCVARGDTKGLAEIADFAESLLRYNWRIRGRDAWLCLHSIEKNLDYRLWDASILVELNTISRQIGTIQKDDPYERWRRRNPSKSWYEKIRQRGRLYRQRAENLHPYFEQYRQTVARLRPEDFANTRLLGLPRRHRRHIYGIGDKLWPLTTSSQEYLQAFPIKAELTESGDIFARYLSGWLFSARRGLKNYVHSLSESAFNDDRASFEQRASVAYWDRKTNRCRKVVDEFEANSHLKESMTPELAYMMFELADRAAVIADWSSDGRDTAERYRSLADDYIAASANLDPDWALAQLMSTIRTLDRMLEETSKATWNKYEALPFVSDSQALEIRKQTRAFNQAADARRLLAYPWLRRVSLDEIQELKPGYLPVWGYLEIKAGDEETYVDNLPILVADLLAVRGAKDRDSREIADAFRFLRKLICVDRGKYSSPHSLRYCIGNIIRKVSENVSHGEKKGALERLAEVPMARIAAFQRLHDWKTRAYVLTDEEREAASESWQRRMDTMADDFSQVLEEVIEIVLSLEPEDFRD